MSKIILKGNFIRMLKINPEESQGNPKNSKKGFLKELPRDANGLL